MTFETKEFFETNGSRVSKSNLEIITKFAEITGIQERRYAKPDQVASDLGFLASEEAIVNASIDRETLDYIIVAHNFGDMQCNTNRVNMVPSLASRIKAYLKFKIQTVLPMTLPLVAPDGWKG